MSAFSEGWTEPVTAPSTNSINITILEYTDIFHYEVLVLAVICIVLGEGLGFREFSRERREKKKEKIKKEKDEEHAEQ